MKKVAATCIKEKAKLYICANTRFWLYYISDQLVQMWSLHKAIAAPQRQSRDVGEGSDQNLDLVSLERSAWAFKLCFSGLEKS